LEDWALIRRLAAEGVPKARIAERLGISRTTVTKAVNSDATHHRGNGAGFGEAFGVADREVLSKFRSGAPLRPEAGNTLAEVDLGPWRDARVLGSSHSDQAPRNATRRAAPSRCSVW